MLLLEHFLLGAQLRKLLILAWLQLPYVPCLVLYLLSLLLQLLDLPLQFLDSHLELVYLVGEPPGLLLLDLQFIVHSDQLFLLLLAAILQILQLLVQVPLLPLQLPLVSE